MLKPFLVGMIAILSLTAFSANAPTDHPTILISKSDQTQINCLADNIYFEARGQSLKGQLAVALVTLNRTMSPKFPSTVCGVVHQQHQEVCQFSWWCDPALKAKAIAVKFTESEKQVYNQIRKLATWIYNHPTKEDITHGATFFHTSTSSPNWSGVVRTVRIEDHVFYKAYQ